MNDRADIQYGQTFTDTITDDDGPVDLTDASVVFQYRSDCGTIIELLATIENATAGQVSVTGVPVGSYKYRWKVIASGETDPIPSPSAPSQAAITYGHGSPEGVNTGAFQGQEYIDLDTGGVYVFLGTPGTNTGWS